jgi:hypothetical protein
MRQEVKLDQTKRDRRPFLEGFSQNHVVLSDQKVSGSSKNSWRKLRPSSTRSENVVNFC